jgi:hypothetical protein
MELSLLFDLFFNNLGRKYWHLKMHEVCYYYTCQLNYSFQISRFNLFEQRKLLILFLMYLLVFWGFTVKQLCE